MNLKEDLLITCRTTCGCGNELMPYTKQIETTHYLLTCSPYSDDYKHPLLIAIDKNSPIFEKARKWDKLTQQDYLRVPIGNHQGKPVNAKQNQKLRELVEEKIEDFASRKLPHVVIYELQKLLKESKK